MKKILIGLALGLCGGFFLVPVKTFAADDVGLVISPPTKEQEILPGNMVEGIIRVTNLNSERDLVVTAEPKDFTAGGLDGEPEFLDESNGSYSLANWIIINKSFDLKSGETKEISYKINVPANAEPGGHYGSVLFTPKVAAGTGANGVVALPTVASLILVTVPGDIAYSGSIKSFSTNKNLYLDSKNLVEFLSSFENAGSVHVKPKGNIVIKNIFGKESAKISYNEKSGNVLPGSPREFKNSWQKDYGFGRYVAELNLTFGENISATSKIVFWIIPLWLTIISLVGLALIVFLIVFIARHISWRKQA